MVAVKLKCIGRVRPLYDNETEEHELVIAEKSNMLVADGLPDAEGRQEFANYELDFAFGPDSHNEQIYDKALVPLVLRCIEGYNVSCISYGASATGKGHTLFGSPEDTGVMMRAINELFLRLEQDKSCVHLVSLSMYQVRHEVISDLLNPEISASLELIEDRTYGHIVKDVCRLVVKNWEECAELLSQGLRVMEMLLKRGSILGKPHIIVDLRVESKTRGSVVTPIKISSCKFVSAAGSGGMMIDADPSLMSFTSCIESLAAKQERHSIPFNSSILTSILRQSIGGNSCTLLMVHVAPTQACLEDTIRTLTLAHNARLIESEPIVNKSLISETIQDIRQEIRDTRSRLQLDKPGKYLHDIDPSLLKQFESLTKQLNQLKEQTWEAIIKQSKIWYEKRKKTLLNSGFFIVLEEPISIDENLINKIDKSRYDLVKQTREVDKAERNLEMERIHLEEIANEYASNPNLQADLDNQRKTVDDLWNIVQHQHEKLTKMKNNFNKNINILVNSEESQRKTYLTSAETLELRSYQEREDWKEIQNMKADERGDNKLNKKLNDLRQNFERDLQAIEGKYADPSLEVTPLLAKQIELDAVSAIFQKSEKSLELTWERDQLLGRLIERDFRHKALLARMQKQMFVVFREYRRHFEEQKRKMEDRFSKLLEDSVKDALKLHEEKTQLQNKLNINNNNNINKKSNNDESSREED